MTLALPSANDTWTFWGPEADTSDSARTDFWIQAAADLVWMYTGIDSTPTDARMARFVGYAIMDMAVYLQASREDVTEDYSPFSGETIGSYSYSKNYRKMAATAGQGGTGVPFFDALVNAVTLGWWATDGLLASAENVFSDVYRRANRSERLLHPDDRWHSGPGDGNLLSDYNSTLSADPANLGMPFGGDGG